MKGSGPGGPGNRGRDSRPSTAAAAEAKKADPEPEGIDDERIPLVVSRRTWTWALDPMVTDLLKDVPGPEKLLKGSAKYGLLTPRHALKILNQLEDRALIYSDSDDRSTINDGKAIAKDAAKLRESLTSAGYKLRKKSAYSDWSFDAAGSKPVKKRAKGGIPSFDEFQASLKKRGYTRYSGKGGVNG